MTTNHANSLLTARVQRHVLPNGLTVLLKAMPANPIVSTMIWYRVGSRNEPAGKTGMSHFLEHMMFKGRSGSAKARLII
jgi:zinc protease